MIKCFAFDFDGVIADTESIWFKILVDFAKAENLDTNETEMALFVGDGDTSVMEHLANKIGGRQHLESKLPAVRQSFRDQTKTLTTRAGLCDYLNYADKNNILLAVASSSSRRYVNDWLKKLGIADRFNAIITRDDVDKIKPHPDIYKTVLNTLNLKACEVVAFEDSVIGCRAAETAGVSCIIVPNRASRMTTGKLPNIKLNMEKTPPQKLLEILKRRI